MTLTFFGNGGGAFFSPAPTLQLPLPLDTLVALVEMLRTLALLALYLDEFELAVHRFFPLNAVNAEEAVVDVETLEIEGAYDFLEDESAGMIVRGGGISYKGGVGPNEGGIRKECGTLGTGGASDFVLAKRLNAWLSADCVGLLLLALRSGLAVGVVGAAGTDRLRPQLLPVLVVETLMSEPGETSR